jgi:hypothetical protein
MKLTSSFLFVATGLILCTSLSAQQYHDAAAFGLKGNVKECKVVKNEDGSSTAWDPHNFSKLSFTKDGRLEFWAEDSYNNDNRVKYISDYVRSNGLLTGFKYSVTSDDSRTYVFYYKEGQLFGYDCVYCEDDSVFGYIEDTSVSAFFFTGSDSFTNKFFGIGNNSKQVDKIIEDGFKKGVDFFPNLKTYYEEDGFLSFFYTSRSFATDYVIKERDSHGNYTILTTNNSSDSIRRIITYWDDEPKPAITEKTPGLRLATPKELSILDLITRPFGVLSQNSRKLSRKQLLYDLSDYGWVDKDKETLKINLRARDGYDMVILGKVPNWAYSEFDYNYDDHDYDTEKTALTSFGYHFIFDKRRESMEFVRRLLSLLEGEGINMKENRKYKYYEGKYGKSIVFLSPTPEGVYLRIRYKTYSPSDWIE